MQVLDNEVHTDGKNTLTSAGALYAMISPNKDVVKPAGKYNKVRIKVLNDNVEHWLNGVKIVEYIYQSNAMWRLVDKANLKQCLILQKPLKDLSDFKVIMERFGIKIFE